MICSPGAGRKRNVNSKLLEVGESRFCLHSTNGTVINKLKLVKKQTCPLETGDVIYVVYRRNEPEHSERGLSGVGDASCRGVCVRDTPLPLVRALGVV